MTLHHQLRRLLAPHPVVCDEVVEAVQVLRPVDLPGGQPGLLVVLEPVVGVVPEVVPGPGGEGPVGQEPGPEVGLEESVSVATLVLVVGRDGQVPAVWGAEHDPAAGQAGQGTLRTPQAVPAVAQPLLLVQGRHLRPLHRQELPRPDVSGRQGVPSPALAILDQD